MGRALLKSAVFLFSLFAVVWIMATLTSSHAFWSVMNIRFSQDERYQAVVLRRPFAVGSGRLDQVREESTQRQPRRTRVSPSVSTPRIT